MRASADLKVPVTWSMTSPCVCLLQEELRRSSYGAEASEESDVDQSPPLPRRGRRQAIFDSKVQLTHIVVSSVWLTRPTWTKIVHHVVR